MITTNKFYFVFLVSILVTSVFDINSLHAQTWHSLNGPLESNISNIVVWDDTVYVSSIDLGGFFKKHKDANSWTFINIPLMDAPNAIAIGPDGTYYVGGTGMSTDRNFYRFYVSSDFGESGELQHTGLYSCAGAASGVQNIIVTQKESLVIDCGGRIFKFDTNEESFKETAGNAGLSTNQVHSFYEHADTLMAGRVNGFLYSTDDGSSWSISAFDSMEVFSIAYADDKLFLGTNKGLYSANTVNGTFEPVEDMANLSVYTLHTYQNQLIAGTNSGGVLIKPNSFDVLRVFEDAGLAPIKAVNSIGDMLLFGSERGFYECNLVEESCTLAGVPNSWVRTMNLQNQDTLWVGTTDNIHRYFINQERWDTLQAPIGRARNIIPAGNDSFYAAAGHHFYRCAFSPFSCDSQQIDSEYALFDLKQNTAGELFIASRAQVFKSTDNGETWQTIYTSSEKRNSGIETFADSLLFINSGQSIRYHLNEGIYDTLNYGADLITRDGIMFAIGNGIQKSTDFGETWTSILRSSDITNQRLGGLKFLLYDEEKNKLYAITTRGDVYVTEDGGTHWGVNEEMYPMYIESVALGADETLYLGSMLHGVFFNNEPLDPRITVSNEIMDATHELPKNFNVGQNYPNPFNPSTTLPFELAQAAEVSMMLYNVFGQKVAEYNLGHKNAGSYQHQILFDRYASGIYFLRVSAGDKSQMLKLTFIK